MAEGLFSKTLVADGWFDKTAQADGWFDDAQLQNPEPPPSTTITISNNTGATYSGVIESSLREANPNNNYQTNDFLGRPLFEVSFNGVGDKTNTVIRFTGLSSVTPGGVVSNSKIRIYLTDFGGTSSISAFLLKRLFTINQVTWNVYSTSNNWQVAGGFGSDDKESTAFSVLSGLSSSNIASYVELTGVDLDAIINDVVNNSATNFGVILQASNQTNPNGYVQFAKSNGTDGTRIELVFDYDAGGGGTTTVDLTLSTLGFSSKTNQNRSNAINTAPQFSWSAKQLQNTSRTSHTAGVFDWTAQAVQNRQTVTPTSAILNWSAKGVTFASNVGLVIVDLLASTFSWSAKSVQNLVRTSHTATTLNWSAKAIQNRLTAIMNVTSFGFSAKSLQNRLTASLTATQLKWQGLPISPTRIIALSAALWASWSAKVVQNRIIVALTRALLNLQSLQITYVSDAIVAVVKRFKSRLSRYRQLLKQRRY